MSGSVCVLPVRDDGSLDGVATSSSTRDRASIPRVSRGPHAHSVTLDPANRYAFVPDLGLDKLLIYRFDDQRGMLEPNGPGWIKMKPGAGPRHVALHPGGRFAYLVNELEFDGGRAGLRRADRRVPLHRLVPTLPEGFDGASTCADIQVSPSGRFVYASNRGHDSIASTGSNQRTGRLTYVGARSDRGGRTPRSFCHRSDRRVPARGQPGQRYGGDLPHRRAQRPAAADRPCRATCRRRCASSLWRPFRQIAKGA